MRRSAVGILPAAMAAVALSAASHAGQEAAPPVPQPSAPAASAAARIVVEKEVIDLGEVTRGAKAEATFVLRNTGAAPVKILSAKPG